MRVCIDFETTGLPGNGRRPGITQIAACKFPMDTSVLHKDYYRYQTLINPELPPTEEWSEKAIEITGIGPEQVKDAPTFFQALPGFAEFVTGCDEWVGYNCEFDVQMLEIALERYGFKTHFPWPFHRTDVMQMARKEMQVKKGYKLSDAYEYVTGKTLDGAHDAMIDVLATIEVLKGFEND